MSSNTPLTDSINNLTTYANSVTGASDTNLSDAVATLASGYGGGGGGNPNENLIKWADGTLTTLDLTGAEYISARFRTISAGSSFTVYAPDATEIESYAFHQSTKLVGFDGKKVEKLGNQCFYNTRISLIVLPSLSHSGQTNTFNQASALTVADFGGITSLGGSFFANCTNLSTLILRKSDEITTLSNINVFTSSPFASGGTGGTLYVPQSLVSSYQSAKNWSTILGYTNNQIKSIESTHTNPNASIDLTLYYADGTLIASS